MRTAWLGLIAAFGVAVGVQHPVGLHGQSPRPMTLVDLREVPSVLDPQLAPDGRAVLYQFAQNERRRDEARSGAA